MYDMEKINALLGLSSSDDATDAAIEFMDEDDASVAVNIATEIPQTTTAYGHSVALGRGYGCNADIDRSEVERYLSWAVDRVPLTLHTGQPVNSHVANVRSDSRQVIGVVTAGFQTIQNQELIDLADAVRNDQQLQFCNAGVVAGGARVFFQCRGDSFDIGDGDEVTPFMLFCNGPDGSLSCRLTPMTKRMQHQRHENIDDANGRFIQESGAGEADDADKVNVFRKFEHWLTMQIAKWDEHGLREFKVRNHWLNDDESMTFQCGDPDESDESESFES